MPSKKEVWSWSLYDFANSAYAGLVPVLLFPLYYKSIVLHNSPQADLWWGIAAGASILLAGLFAPLVGAYADLTKRRKFAFIIATLLAVVGTAALAIASYLSPLSATLIFIATNLSFNVAVTLYDSLLFNVSSKENSGSVSNKGWALGYVGGLICTVLVYSFLKKGVNNPTYVLSFVIVAVFYLIFALPAFKYVKETELLKPESVKNPVKQSFRNIFSTLKNWRKYKHLFLFLAAFYFFSEGIVTLQYFSAIYANTTLHISASELAILFVGVQIVAIPATLWIGKQSDKMDRRKILIWTLVVWCLGTILLALTVNRVMLYAVFVLMALVIGGSQATTRAWFNDIIPSNKRSELFGFNALASKISATIGPPIFGLISIMTGSQRIAVFSILAYFLVSLILFVKIKK